MRHSIEDLGDFAEDHSYNGTLEIRQRNRRFRSGNGGDHKVGRWAVRVNGAYHYGETPDEAVKKMLSHEDLQRNPDRGT